MQVGLFDSSKSGEEMNLIGKCKSTITIFLNVSIFVFFSNWLLYGNFDNGIRDLFYFILFLGGSVILDGVRRFGVGRFELWINMF